jgi:hypothetical protein
VRDGPAEPGSGGRFSIDVDELVILSGVGKRIDPCLIDRQPGRDTDLLSHPGADFVDVCEWHGPYLQGCE